MNSLKNIQDNLGKIELKIKRLFNQKHDSIFSARNSICKNISETRNSNAELIQLNN